MVDLLNRRWVFCCNDGAAEEEDHLKAVRVVEESWAGLLTQLGKLVEEALDVLGGDQKRLMLL